MYRDSEYAELQVLVGLLMNLLSHLEDGSEALAVSEKHEIADRRLQGKIKRFGRPRWPNLRHQDLACPIYSHTRTFVCDPSCSSLWAL